MNLRPHDFVDPPWGAALRVDACIAEIPDAASIAGMFYLALIEGAKRRGVELSLPKQRYVAFQFYSVREFAVLLVQAAELFYPGRPLRQALRALGTLGPKAFAASTLGKVTLGSAEGPQAAVTAIAKTYEINIRTSRCTVLKSDSRSMQLALENVHHFLDCHHVGVFEGTLEHAGSPGRVRIASRSRSAATLLLEW